MISKNRIVDGCEILFLTAGIKAVTMDDIARHLGISKKTIYQHFTDKDNLVYALVEQRISADEQRICLQMSQSGSMIAGLISMEKHAKEIFARVNPIVVHDLQKYHPRAWSLFQQFKAGFLVRTLESLLEKGIAEGFIRPEINVRIIAKMRVGQIEAGFNQNLFPVAEFDLWEVQSQFLDLFNYGICTVSGVGQLNQLKSMA